MGTDVITVSRFGGPLFRWWRYARALRNVARDADIVEAFSSVSVGVPLLLTRLTRPKKILRLGGDFFWERYTDRGGTLGLAAWYASRPWSKFLTQRILRFFHHIIFSTRFEEELYEREYVLPSHSVVENAFPSGQPTPHVRHAPFRLLFVGRFVGFKNLMALLRSLPLLDDMSLTLVGDGPLTPALHTLVESLGLRSCVEFRPPVSGMAKMRLLLEHDLLILPSLTEISPHVALEARAAGLPVLLTQETGLSEGMARGMVLDDLSTPEGIALAIRDVRASYDVMAHEASLPAPLRGWEDVAREHLSLFQRL